MVRFSVIGLNHNHIYGQVNLLLRAGAELASFYAPEPDLVALFSRTYPQAKLASGVREILEDEAIQLVVSAGIPSDRASLGIEVMKHGKDYMSDSLGYLKHE
jgi:predicted dehydrogenase